MTLPRSTSILLGLLILCAGVLGGIQAQKTWGATPASANSALPEGFRQRGGFPTGGGGNTTGQPAASAPTTGTVKLVDGTTVYIQTTDGRTITVNTDGNTKVSTATPQTLKDLKTGQTVTITGSAADTNTMTASSITAAP